MTIYSVQIEWHHETMFYGTFEGSVCIGCYTTIPLAKKAAKEAMLTIADRKACIKLKPRSLAYEDCGKQGGNYTYFFSDKCFIDAVIRAVELDKTTYKEELCID